MKRKAPGIWQLACGLAAAVFAAVQRRVGWLLLFGVFLAGLGLGSYLALQHLSITGKCAYFLQIDPMGNVIDRGEL